MPVYEGADRTFYRKDQQAHSGPYGSVCGDTESGIFGIDEKDEKGGMSPERIASAIVHQATRKRMKPTVTPGLQYKAINVLYAILPRRFALWIIGLLYA